MVKKGIVILSFLILLVIGTVVTIHSSYFEVKSVKILGIHQLNAVDIVNVVGNLEGQNIFLIPGRELVDNLLNLTRVKGVKIERNLPDTLIIQVNERSTLGLFKDNNNRWVEVSADGKILKVYGDETLPQLPHINGLIINSTNGQVDASEELSRFFNVLTLFFPLQSKITNISYDPQDIQIRFTTGTTLYFGQAINVQKRYEIFSAIWEDSNFNLEKIEYIDLRYEDNPVIRLFN